MLHSRIFIIPQFVYCASADVSGVVENYIYVARHSTAEEFFFYLFVAYYAICDHTRTIVVSAHNNQTILNLQVAIKSTNEITLRRVNSINCISIKPVQRYYR